MIGVVLVFDIVDSVLKVIFENEDCVCFFCGCFDLELFCDEVDNYYFNLILFEFWVFVMWWEEEGFVLFIEVILSYGEVVCWLDFGEYCDGVVMLLEIVDWLGDFVNIYYKLVVWIKIKCNDLFVGKC